MICPKCGQESAGNYCSNCGSPLEFDGSEPFEVLDIEDIEDIDDMEDIVEPYYEKPRERAARPKPAREKHGSRSAEKKAARKDKKESEKKEARMKKLENEVNQLRARRENDRLHARNADDSYRAVSTATADSGNQVREREDLGGISLGEAAVKGVAATAVIVSRLMQTASFLLMACMVVVMAQSFWDHGQELGDIRFIVEEANYGMALYVGAAGITLFMGLVWCLWILSKKGAGGGVRLKKYDTGRGLLPFLISMAAVVAAGIILPFIPLEAEAWRGLASGAKMAAEAVDSQRNLLFLCSAAGAVLSLVRKTLRV